MVLHRLFSLLSLGLLLTTCLCLPSSQARSEQGGSHWDKVRQAFDDNDNVPNAVLVVGDSTRGRIFLQEKGSVTSISTLPTASLIKWMTGTVILKLVQQGIILSLNDSPQDYLDWWTTDSNDPRSQVTIQQLLSFTSGFRGRPFFDTPACISEGATTIEDCAKEIYNEWFEYTPGTTFVYGPSHHQILGAIALAATNRTLWNQVFQTHVAQPLGMKNTVYDEPSRTNPRLSAGAVTTAEDVERFLLGLLRANNGIVENNTTSTSWGDGLLDLMAVDGTPTEFVAITNPGDGNPDHYGASVWLECTEGSWEEGCDESSILLTATGAFGYHAWIDPSRQLYGILAMRLFIVGGSTVASNAAKELRPLIDEALQVEYALTIVPDDGSTPAPSASSLTIAPDDGSTPAPSASSLTNSPGDGSTPAPSASSSVSRRHALLVLYIGFLTITSFGVML